MYTIFFFFVFCANHDRSVQPAALVIVKYFFCKKKYKSALRTIPGDVSFSDFEQTKNRTVLNVTRVPLYLLNTLFCNEGIAHPDKKFYTDILRADKWPWIIFCTTPTIRDFDRVFPSVLTRRKQERSQRLATIVKEVYVRSRLVDFTAGPDLDLWGIFLI